MTDAPVINDAELDAAFAGANFGHVKHRQLLESSVFKKMVGYHCGHTVTVIMKNLGLIGHTGVPTKKGRALVAEAYGHLMKVSG